MIGIDRYTASVCIWTKMEGKNRRAKSTFCQKMEARIDASLQNHTHILKPYKNGKMITIIKASFFFFFWEKYFFKNIYIYNYNILK